MRRVIVDDPAITYEDLIGWTRQNGFDPKDSSVNACLTATRHMIEVAKELGKWIDKAPVG